jgi:hypothetical protein
MLPPPEIKVLPTSLTREAVLPKLIAPLVVKLLLAR